MSRKRLFISEMIGPDGRSYSGRILAHDRREARRIAESGAALSGSSVVAVDVDGLSLVHSKFADWR